MKLFHLTRLQNLDSIRKNGIIPGHPTRGFAKNQVYNQDVIWLTDSPQYIIKTQIGPHYYNSRQIVILQVDMNKYTILTKICHCLKRPSIHEFVCFERIDPKDIVNIDNLKMNK